MLADGYRWYQVSGPISTWAPVEPVRSGNWVAGSQGSTTYLGPRLAPNTTIVAAAIAGLSFGAGGAASLGPSAAARAARAFSPNGDGSEDGLVLRWSNRITFDALVLRVFRSDGHLAGTVNVPDRGRGVQSWAWNGAVGGHRLPDGHYAIQLVGRAGGVTYTAPSIAPLGTAQVLRFGVTIDTIGPRMTGGAISARVVSPPRDGRFDRIALAGSSTGATHWRLTAAPIVGGRLGVPVRTIGGPGGSPRVSWNGWTDRGLPAPDGRYRLTLAVFDEAGNSQARAWDVIVDGTAPNPGLSATPPTFSPNGDGAADRTVVRWSTAEAASVTFRITHGTRIVRTFPARRMVTGGAFAWDGRVAGGARVADGVYGVRITTQDVAGNRRTVVLRLVVDRTAGRLRWKPAAFYPQDLDALARAATASFQLDPSSDDHAPGRRARGSPMRTAWHGRPLGPGTARWTWDGRDGAGALVPPGGYTLVLTASGRYGTTVLRQAIVVDAFAVSLSATRLRAGQHLTVTFRSVEPLGGRPAVTFDQTGLRPVRLRRRRGAGPLDRHVPRREGGAGRASIRVARPMPAVSPTSPALGERALIGLGRPSAGRRRARGRPAHPAGRRSRPVHLATMTVEPTDRVTPTEVQVTVSPMPPSDASQPIGTGAWVVLPDLQRGGQPARRSPRRSSTHCPARRSSSSTTARPTGRVAQADELAAADDASGSATATAKQGLGRAYLDGFGRAIEGGAAIVVQMDADWSPRSRPYLPALIGPIVDGGADLVIGSRYIARRRGARLGPGPAGRSRAAEPLRAGRPRPPPARPDRWLQGVARDARWRRSPFEGVHAGGYVFQIEMTYRASRLRRPRGRDPDRVPGPARRAVEDVAPDHRRGADRRPDPALGRAPRPRSDPPRLTQRPAVRRGPRSQGLGRRGPPDLATARRWRRRARRWRRRARRGRRRRRRRGAAGDLDHGPGRHDVDERLAGRQGDLLAGRRVELRRARERLLPPGPLDRPAVRRDPGDAAPGEVRLEPMLVRVAVVERTEVHQHHDHVLRGDPLLGRGVLLLALHADASAGTCSSRGRSRSGSALVG